MPVRPSALFGLCSSNTPSRAARAPGALAFQAQRRVDGVERADAARRRPRRRRVVAAERARRVAVPAQRAGTARLGAASANQRPAPGARGGGVVAVGLRRHRHRAGGEARADGGEALDELARAGGDDDALDGHAVPRGQPLAQRAVGGIGIARRVGVAQRGQRRRARPGRVGGGREVPARRAPRVGPAVRARLPGGRHAARHAHDAAASAIAPQAPCAAARSARRTSRAPGEGAAALSA